MPTSKELITALYQSIAQANLVHIEFLLSTHRDLFKQSLSYCSSYTALDSALRIALKNEASDPVLHALLRAGASMYACDPAGENALSLALASARGEGGTAPNLSAARVFIGEVARVRNEIRSLSCLSRFLRPFYVVNMAKVETYIIGKYFIRSAQCRSSLAVFELLLPHVDRSRYPEALYYAAKERHLAAVDRLLSEGVSANATHPGFNSSYFEGKVDAPVLWAAMLGRDPEICRRLLDAGADVNTTVEWVHILRQALAYPQHELIRVLVTYGAHIYVRHCFGYDVPTILMLAVDHDGVDEDARLTDCILHSPHQDQLAASINLQTDTGLTALMRACQYRKLVVVKKLILAGALASLDSYDKDQHCTALMFAVLANAPSIARLLLLLGANKAQHDKYYRSASRLAEQKFPSSAVVNVFEESPATAFWTSFDQEGENRLTNLCYAKQSESAQDSILRRGLETPTDPATRVRVGRFPQLFERGLQDSAFRRRKPAVIASSLSFEL